ncbi:MAG: DUF4870 family protein [Alphaproteobacteria bacterium]
MDTWHVIDRAGRQHGPLSHYDAAKTIQSGMASGAFGPESEIWHQSFGATWKTIATSEFAHLLGQPGPPPRGPSGPPPYQAPHAQAPHHQPAHPHAQHQRHGTSGWDGGPFTAGVPFFPEKTIVVIVYVLYLLGILSFLVTPLIGLVIAYVQRGSSTHVGRSHFTFQIHTFWLPVLFWVLFWLASLVFGLVFAGIGAVNPAAGLSGLGLWFTILFVFAIGLYLWHLVRVIKGLVVANGNRAIAQPASWWLG